ncbi:hypothetical protein S2M10_33710 [Sphingomonas sp. S2M10]|uniref:cell wall hydrolase n=1 Tax=Sphingomonas sp. S2M10 TaxID=2705010 RepID=UPI0016A7B380|nr:cell wall hydrolase [Sphingomonas sp. S2M10]NLS28361.1 hypothetical protein [Sphingomonas sp. S2M10]
MVPRRGSGGTTPAGFSLLLRVAAAAPVLLQPSPIAQAQERGAGASAVQPQDVECLATAIAYEAGFEPVEGRRAVAEVVLNRVRAKGFPKTVCEVVYQGSARKTGCQFTFTCDGALRLRLPAQVLAEARSIAAAALAGGSPPLVAGATHYHAAYVSPRWAPSLARITQIGAHIFYRRQHAGALPPMAQMTPAVRPAAAAPVRPFAPWGLAPPAALPPQS